MSGVQHRRKTRGRRVKLVITCRDFYWGVFKGPFWGGATVNPLPADIAEDEEGASGSGDFNRFTTDEQEIALGLYLKHYGISGRPIGDAVEQLRHPLLLRFFCEAYRGQEVEELEDIRLKELFDRYWDQKLASVAERMIKAGGGRPVGDVLQDAVPDVAVDVSQEEPTGIRPRRDLGGDVDSAASAVPARHADAVGADLA